MLKIFSNGLLLCIVVSMSACANYKPTPPAFQSALNQPYTLDSGDQLRVTVFEQNSLTNNYTIDKAGYLSFPLVGAIPARGRTPDQIKAQIVARLKKGYLKDPDVTVEVVQYRPFFIMGEITNGGQYSYFPGMTVQKAIAAAGGYTPRAQQESVDITRQVNDQIVIGRVLTSDPILPGDTIYVRERWF